MFINALKEVKGLFDGRFLLVCFFPSLVFCAYLVGVATIVNRPADDALLKWQALAVEVKGFYLAAFFAVVAFLAILISARSDSRLRLFEGYWNFPFADTVKKIFRRRHQKQLANLAAQISKAPSSKAYEDVYLYFPPPSRPNDVMPTRLGNILKSAELYPQLRYRIDAVLIWPRLYHVLPKSFLQVFSMARSSLDLALVIASLTLLSIPISAVCLGLSQGWKSLLLPIGFWIWSACGSIVLAWLSYRAALGAALLYSEQIKSAFDLYRNALLEQLCIPMPKSLAAEEQLWSEVCKFIYRNAPERRAEWIYQVPTTRKKEHDGEDADVESAGKEGKNGEEEN